MKVEFIPAQEVQVGMLMVGDEGVVMEVRAINQWENGTLEFETSDEESVDDQAFTYVHDPLERMEVLV